MTERLLILLIVLALGLVLVAWRERSGSNTGRIAPGINVVVGPGCRLCGPLIAALEGAGAEFTVMNLEEAGERAFVRSLPTVLVGDRAGEVIFRRSGRSAISDLEAILTAGAVSDTLTEGT
jgi:hypothetical protein